MTEIAFLYYDQMTALDSVGPYEILGRLPDAEVRFVATTPGPISTDVGLQLTADAALNEVPAPDIILVPGGPGTFAALEDTAAVDWLRQAHTTSRRTTSVCTGAPLPGAAGVLAGKRATTHWITRDMLAQFGAEPVGDRVVVQEKVITAARGLGGHRHGADAGSDGGRRGRGPRHPAGHRVRPPAPRSTPAPWKRPARSCGRARPRT